ncbi:MAG: hypothetical protein H0W07_07030 [Chloroflexi bacterium]|nr:hypothetical protein [Chloroflexota bacterium]
MPESPDLEILADAFHAGLVGRPLASAETPQSLVLRGTPAELDGLRGQVLTRVVRRGKFLAFTFDRDLIIVNAMLTGRLGFARPGAKAWSQTAAVFRFGARLRNLPLDAAPWTAGARWLPADDEPVELRYRDATRMGKIYLMPEGVSRPVPGWDEQGPDAADGALDLEAWRRRIAKHQGELKNLLKNQAFVAGIGNGYSDEILWAAGLAPFRKRSALAPDEVDRLYTATRDVLAWAVSELRERVPPKFEVEVRDYLKVHRKGGSPCPRCGTRLSELSPGGFVTTFCRTCQR